MQTMQEFPLSLVAREEGILLRTLQKFQFYLLKQSTIITTPTRQYQKQVKQLLHKEAIVIPLPIKSIFFTKKEATPQNQLDLLLCLASKMPKMCIYSSI